VEVEALLRLVTEADLTVRLLWGVGAYVVGGTPLFLGWPAERVDDGVAGQLLGTVAVGDERLMVQDLLYGMQQLSDVALRAISPAINDPSTALNCIDGLTSLLAQVAQRPEVSPYHWDSEGIVRLFVPRPDLAAALEVAFNPIRHYARTDTSVVLRLIDACRQIGYMATRDADRKVLWEHVVRTAYSADRHLESPWERAAVNRHLILAAEAFREDAGPVMLVESSQ
jgi:uncharacterized membrane protein